MGKIVVLDELTANKIAAGEVIERPASVVKELVENSIDAGASNITVEIKRGGITYIRVTDNGYGIPEDDVLLAFEKHATSKIKCGDDLDSIITLGFRGEALASIAAVSKVELSTRTADSSIGTKVVIHGGGLVENIKCGCPEGTTFIIRDLFFNTPARFKFLKKDATEAGHIIDVIERIALAKPDISFSLINSGSEVLRTPGDGELKNAVFSIYGRDVVRNIKKMHLNESGIEVSGYCGNIETAISGRSRQSIYINGRYVKSKIITAAIDEAYKTLMMKGKNPFIILKIDVNPHNVDVNVHPTKMEVRFSDENAIFRSVYGAITDALLGSKQIDDSYNLSKLQNFHRMTISENKYESMQLDLTAPNKDIAKPETNIESARSEMTVNVESNQERLIEQKDQNVSKNIFQEKQPDPPSPDAVFDSKIVFHEEKQANTNNHYDNEKEISNLDADRLLLKEATYIGQVFNTYIILQYKDEIIFIDQHAAHERVLFEKLKKNVSDKNAVSQLLMAPVAIELTRSEYQTYKNNEKIFADMGFSIDDFGANSILVRALPAVLDNSDIKPIIIETVREIMEGTGKGKTLKPEDKLYDIACKAAVKANMKLDIMEVKELQKSMSELINPFTCPHGRPLSFKMTKRDLEKRFKRIV